MAAYYSLKIVTPQGSAYSGEVRHSSVPVGAGSVGVLANHAPFITSSDGGTFVVDQKDGTKAYFEVGAGFFNIAQNVATFLTASFKNKAEG